MKSKVLLPTLCCGFISFAILFVLWSYLGREQTLPEPGIPVSHKLECISYTPFMGREKPGELGVSFHIPRERLEQDFEIISQRFECVRLYFMEGLEAAPAVAQEKGLQLILSAWIGANPVTNEREVQRLIETARRYKPIVKFVLVGNETLLRHEQTETEMMAWVRRVKKELPDIPVSYGEVLGFWKHDERLAEVVDFLTIHILPYWSDVPPDIADAANYTEWDFNQMVTQYPGKTFFVGEIGWPSQGRTREHSVPSPVNEARFFRAVIPRMEKLGWHYNIIEAFDQPWKRSDEGCVGGYWGVFDTHRKDKHIFEGTVSNFPDWKVLFWASVAILVLLMTVVLVSNHLSMRRTWPPLTAVFVLASFSLVKQGHELLLTVFSPVGAVKGLLLLLFALASAILLVCVLVSQKIPQHLSWSDLEARRKAQKLFSYDCLVFIFEQIVVFLLVTISLGLVFEGRSTSLPGFGLTLPVLALCYFSVLRGRERHVFFADSILSLTLLVVTMCLLVSEGIWNSQANLWMGLCVLAALSLLPFFSRVSLQAVLNDWMSRPVVRALICVAIVWGGAVFVRNVLMESRYGNLDVACQDQPLIWYCQLRAWMGIGIHFKICGFAALFLLLFGILLKRTNMAFAALLVALAGLVWYQSFPSSAVLVLALVYLVTKRG